MEFLPLLVCVQEAGDTERGCIAPGHRHIPDLVEESRIDHTRLPPTITVP